MKRIACALLTLALLFGLTAWAEEEEWETYESDFGYSIRYPASLVKADRASQAGEEMDLFVPKAGWNGAVMWCRLVTDPDAPDWEAEGYERQTVDEPSVEMADVPLDMHYRLFESADWAEMLEEVRLADDDGGFEYVFDLRFPSLDEEGWREIFEAMLETVQYPPQGAVAGSFGLWFDLDGDISFEDVVVDEDADPIILYPDPGVRDFVLEEVVWDEETMTIEGAKPLYQAEEFTGAESLRIFCYIPDVLPTLRVRAVNAQGEAECWYIFQSGRDGSLLLLSESDVLF